MQPYGQPNGPGQQPLGSWQQPQPPQVPGAPPPDASKKFVAGLLAIFLGELGVHKFILGYTKAGIIMLAVTLCTCGLGALVMWPIALIEGFKYLTQSDEDFVANYIQNQRPWF